MDRRQLIEILAKHKIAPAFHTEFCNIVLQGKRPSVEMQTRLQHVIGYKAALDEALTVISAVRYPVATPSFVTRFESLEIGEFA